MSVSSSLPARYPLWAKPVIVLSPSVQTTQTGRSAVAASLDSKKSGLPDDETKQSTFLSRV
jgi:hypothetical protein